MILEQNTDCPLDLLLRNVSWFNVRMTNTHVCVNLR